MFDHDKKCLTCDGHKVVVQNAGYCGGCEICGNIEEQTVPCPDCCPEAYNEDDFSGATEGDR